MKKINIMFLLLSFDVGGTERHVFNLISNLKRGKFNCVVCCLYHLGSVGTMLVNKEGIKVYHNLIRNKWDIFGICKLICILRDENIHILYTINSPLTQFWGTVSAKLSGINANITRVARTKPTYHAKRRKIINKLTLFFVDKVIAQAYSQKEYLTCSEGFQPEKIEVIYNGVDLKQFNKPFDTLTLKQTVGIPLDSPVIGVVARLSKEKGHEIFLKAAREVLNVFSNAHFLIIGDGQERKKLEEITQELAIQSNVHFLGARKDIPQIIFLLDIAVMSSNFETFSNAILEYMAASKPVIATDAGSTAELVIDKETGFLIPTGDSEALANAILKFLKDKNLAKKMGEEGRKKITEKFTVEKMVAQYESLFIAMVK